MDQFGCLMAGWLAGCVWEQNRLLTFWSAITILIQKIFRSQSSHLDMCLLVSELLWTNYLCVNRFYRNKYSNEGGDDAWKGLATRLRMQWRFCSLKEKAFYRNTESDYLWIQNVTISWAWLIITRKRSGKQDNFIPIHTDFHLLTQSSKHFVALIFERGKSKLNWFSLGNMIWN